MTTQYEPREAVFPKGTAVAAALPHKDHVVFTFEPPDWPALTSPVAGELHFQSGPIGDYGVNGVTNEAVLEGVLLRLRELNQPPFNCRENSLAITHIEEAIHWLEHRTRERRNRGVEGTDTP